ncbi:hypothetical protein MMC30_006308 [Trapelia coarctata]|nr:hypothetical protein [Trapelia coarctata]
MCDEKHRKRGPWNRDEDRWLNLLVRENGPQSWVKISEIIGQRTAKQCRERWHQNLKPSLNHLPISDDEGLFIERCVVEMGQQWANIARKMPGRSDNSIKNWWNGGMNRRKRNLEHRRNSGQSPVSMNGMQYQLPLPQLPPNLPQQRSVNHEASPNLGSQALSSSYPADVRRTLPPLGSSMPVQGYSEHRAQVRAPQNIMVPRPGTMIGGSTISPLGNPPSLVDDNGTVCSTSPELAHPSAVQMPVVGRQSSAGDRNLRITTSISEGSPRSGFAPPPYGPEWKRRVSHPTATPLHHLADMAITEGSQPSPRDTRMELSNLLG